MVAAAAAPQRRADVHSCWKIGDASIDVSITTVLADILMSDLLLILARLGTNGNVV